MYTYIYIYIYIITSGPHRTPTPLKNKETISKAHKYKEINSMSHRNETYNE